MKPATILRAYYVGVLLETALRFATDHALAWHWIALLWIAPAAAPLAYVVTQKAWRFVRTRQELRRRRKCRQVGIDYDYKFFRDRDRRDVSGSVSPAVFPELVNPRPRPMYRRRWKKEGSEP